MTESTLEIIKPICAPVREHESHSTSNQPNDMWRDHVHDLKYDGQYGSIFGIWALNLVLKVLTFGIYSFWGKTRMRRYLVESISLMGDRLTYTGRGVELLLGFLKALPFFAAFVIIIVMTSKEMLNTILFSMYIPLLILALAGSYAGLRYHYSRVHWR